MRLYPTFERVKVIMFDGYLWVKALHICGVMFWLAGLLMMPRFFVYQRSSVVGGELDLKMIEAADKLHKIILTPALIVSFICGVILFVYRADVLFSSAWLIIKFLFVFLLIGYHGFLSGERKKFAQGERPRNERFYRLINEIPAIITIIIVILAIVEPF